MCMLGLGNYCYQSMQAYLSHKKSQFACIITHLCSKTLSYYYLYNFAFLPTKKSIYEATQFAMLMTSIHMHNRTLMQQNLVLLLFVQFCIPTHKIALLSCYVAGFWFGQFSRPCPKISLSLSLSLSLSYIIWD